MKADLRRKAQQALQEVSQHLEEGILAFWLTKSVDPLHGGYLVCFAEDGEPTGDTDKYLLAQTRLIWGFSALARSYPGNSELREAARQGVDFLIKHFWDHDSGGWFCSVGQAGEVIDAGKLVYGQSFAIYALAEYTLSTGDPRGLAYAEKTFDLLQTYCTDTARGGYYENLEQDWTISASGVAAGDRKSLDVHMHLMEAFTTLAQCSGKEIHRRTLRGVIAIILKKMINWKYGSGLCQFDLDFKPVPAIPSFRVFDPEWAARESGTAPAHTTSYGHNVELAWLLNRAGQIAGTPSDHYHDATRRLVDHARRYGLDKEVGGVYREGPHDGPTLGRNKEWWQNSEALVGFLDAFVRLDDEEYFDAFWITWDFVKKHFINWQIGEWRSLLDGQGNVLLGDLGSQRKVIYHTGRAALEVMGRLARVVGRS